MLQFSGKIDRLALAALDKLNEVSVQAGKLAPSAVNDYVRDFWQRSVLFLDILRRRGNRGSVLIYDSELVMRGDELPHLVNYSLLRVIPPEGVEIDNRKRPSSSSIRVPGRDRGLAASSS